MRRPPAAAIALTGGLCLAASTPPWGFWILAFPGIVCFDVALGDSRGRARFGRAWLVWAALLFPSLFWMRAMTAPGYVIASIAYAGFLATGTMLAPRGPGRYLALPGGVMLAEWVRWRWPFGGVPLSNLAIGQVDGPLAPMLGLGGALFVVGATVTVGLGIAAAVRRQPRLAAALGTVAVATLLVAVDAPAGAPTGVHLDVAAVQGGGPQGTRAATTDANEVFLRHLAASEEIDPARRLDLVVWPEDVVDVVQLVGSREESELAALARRVGATLVAGVVEDEGDAHFRNWAVVYDPEGTEIDRYEKVERVPFGEWVPFRSLLVKLAGDALPARDAMIGREPAVVDSPVGRLGVSISWEIFFGERAREAAAHGGELLLNPTNGASFDGTQVQTQQVASSRMRAIETGRWVVQAAPTGFSAIVDPDGRVLQRTAVSEQRVLYDTVELRTGTTIYTRYGDAVALAFAVVGLGLGWAVERRGLPLLLRSRSGRSRARR